MLSAVAKRRRPSCYLVVDGEDQPEIFHEGTAIFLNRLDLHQGQSFIHLLC